MPEEEATQAITEELFSHLVQLAALELAPEEANYLRKELNSQLKAINELAAIPVDESTPIASHGIPYTAQITPAIRSDDWIPYADTEAILSQVPQVEDGYIIVPDIPHEQLG